jgi:hypothetical protein
MSWNSSVRRRKPNCKTSDSATRELPRGVSGMNLFYDFWFEQELKIATKAGLDIGAAIRLAKDICLRFEKSGCISQWDLQ